MSKVVKRVLIALGVVIVAFFVVSFFLDRYFLSQIYERQPQRDTSVFITYEDVQADYPRQDVQFQLNGSTLRGHVYGADNDGRGLVVFRHGIFSQDDDYLALTTALVDRGWKVFSYDALGCGESDGNSTLGFPQSPLDVRAAVDFAYSSGLVGDLPVMLMGHSWGGYGVAGSLDFEDVRTRVKACVVLSGFDTPYGIITESTRRMVGPFGVTQNPTIWLNNKLAFGNDADRSAARAISESGLPVLVVHGTGDAVIAYDGASIMAQRGNIANPNVVYVTESEEGRNGHNDYFYSHESQAYLTECAQQLAQLTEQAGGKLSDAELAAFRSSVDIRRANTADPVLMDQIDSLFGESVSKQ